MTTQMRVRPFDVGGRVILGEYVSVVARWEGGGGERAAGVAQGGAPTHYVHDSVKPAGLVRRETKLVS